jgi:hypothetical protein
LAPALVDFWGINWGVVTLPSTESKAIPLEIDSFTRSGVLNAFGNIMFFLIAAASIPLLVKSSGAGAASYVDAEYERELLPLEMRSSSLGTFEDDDELR